jgi:hypothetical protein
MIAGPEFGNLHAQIFSRFLSTETHSAGEHAQATVPRGADAVPLRMEQTEGDLTVQRQLTELMENGSLRWRLIPMRVAVLLTS